MDWNAEFLARLQFSVTIMFHYIFPPLTIGLGVLMVISEAMFLKTRQAVYEQIARFWTKIFAVIFAMGVASGIVMEFQFGTNWAAYSRYVGDVFGSALAAEGIFAFFLESGFLAVLVFGWDRVSPKVHFFATLMVALGSIFSAVWIVVANSWQQTPAGFHIVGEGLNARAEITDFWAMVFNPSSMHRLNHVLIAAIMAGSFFQMSVSAYYILKGKYLDFAKRSFVIALVLGFIFSLAAPISGHFQARQVAETQPAKLAALEGHFKSSEGGAPIWLFGIPDEEEQRVKYGIPIPGMLSFLVYDSFTKPVTALDTFPREDWPPVQITFQSYHLMVLAGLFCIAVTIIAMVYWRKGTLFDQRWLLWIFVFSVLVPIIANETGWVAAEVGRQPWVVYNLLRTSDGISESVSSGQIVGSLIMFCVIYALLLLVWLYVLDDKIRTGPDIKHESKDENGFMQAVTERAQPSGESMTEAHSDRSE